MILSSNLKGDLVGFTAWSSAREPHQVFVLLETLYNSFDKIARKLGVFKVRAEVSSLPFSILSLMQIRGFIPLPDSRLRLSAIATWRQRYVREHPRIL